MASRRSKKTKRAGASRPSRRANRAHIAISKRDRKAGEWFTKMMSLQARLRGPNGCPWDHEQTHESLRKYLIEEAYEVLDAMESGDPRKFADELGDLLLQVVFHSILAEETGAFTISDVIEAVHTKMVRRHPHVFGDVTAESSSVVLKNWEEIKKQERAEGRRSKDSGDAVDESVLAGVPRSLPAVLEAYQLTRKASRVGFDWDSLAGVFDKLEEEKDELNSLIPGGATAAHGKAKLENADANRKLEEETGDLLFAAVNVARFLGIDPEVALKSANAKFKKRFQSMELVAERAGNRFADLPRERKEELWEQVKREP